MGVSRSNSKAGGSMIITMTHISTVLRCEEEHTVASRRKDRFVLLNGCSIGIHPPAIRSRPKVCLSSWSISSETEAAECSDPKRCQCHQLSGLAKAPAG
eukprot:s58_g32.t1